MEEIAKLEHMRDTIHVVIVKVGRLAMSRAKLLAAQDADEDPRRDLLITSQDMKPWIFPVEHHLPHCRLALHC